MSWRELGRLPLTGVQYGRKLKDLGTMRSTLDRQASIAFEPTTLNTVCAVDVNHILVWLGVLSDIDYTQSSTSRTLNWQEYPWLLKRRRLTEDKAYTATDQHAIAKGLLDYTQAKAGGDLRIDTDSRYVASGVNRDRDWKGKDLKVIWDLLVEQSNVENGYDFRFEYEYDDDLQPQVFFRPAYPRIGRRAPQTGIVYEFVEGGGRGNVKDYKWPENGATTANSMWATSQQTAGGTGAGTDALRGSAADPSLTSAERAYPLLEDSKSYQDVADQATLDSHVKADLEAFKRPQVKPEIIQQADTEPGLGTLAEGDDVRFRATSFRHPRKVGGGPGFDGFLRVLQMEVTVPSKGTAQQVHLTLDEITDADTSRVVHPIRDVAPYVADHERRLQALERTTTP